MKTKLLLFFFSLFLCRTVFSQKEFFRSNQHFTPDQLTTFYSSVTLHGEQLLFIANDYHLYAYNRSTGEQQWKSSLDYKTKRQCFAAEGIIFVTCYLDKQERTAVLDSATGKLIRYLPLGPLETTPIMRQGILYGTAIYDKGVLFAFDPKGDSLVWTRFLAHGIAVQPYYFAGHILANAEAHNWVRVNYKGQLMDTTCKTKARIFVEGIPCIKNFNALAHDGSELDEDLSEKIFTDRETISPANTLWALKKSFVFADHQLLIMGNKGKQLKLVELLPFLPEEYVGSPERNNKLLNATGKTVTFLYQYQLMMYDHHAHKLLRSVDLSTWQPEEMLLDGNKIWLISGKDGLLYGLTI